MIKILLWRDVHLTPFEDMGAMTEHMGGVHGFLDFEIRCQKSTRVKSPMELTTDDLVDILFRRKMGYLELIEIEVVSEESQSVPHEVSFSDEVIEELAKSLKDALTASMTADLKSTILSTILAAVKSVIQTERDQMAQTSKQMADDFSESITQKLLAIEK